MKFRIDRDMLLTELGLLAEIVEPKNALATFNHLLVEAAGDEITLTANSLANSLQCRVDAEVVIEGRACLPARKLFEIVRQLPKEPITFSSDETSAAVRCGGSRFK